MNKSSRERDNCIARWVKILSSPAATDFDAANIAHRSKVCWHLTANLLLAVIKKLLHRGDPRSHGPQMSENSDFSRKRAEREQNNSELITRVRRLEMGQHRLG